MDWLGDTYRGEASLALLWFMQVRRTGFLEGGSDFTLISCNCGGKRIVTRKYALGGSSQTGEAGRLPECLRHLLRSNCSLATTMFEFTTVKG